MKGICKKHGTINDSTRFDGKKRCKQCNKEAVTKRRRVLKEKAVEYLGGKCIVCGYHKCISALEFHHRNPLEKDFSISSDGNTRSWEKIKGELDKCDLVCANCHREIHNKIDE